MASFERMWCKRAQLESGTALLERELFRFGSGLLGHDDSHCYTSQEAMLYWGCYMQVVRPLMVTRQKGRGPFDARWRSKSVNLPGLPNPEEESKPPTLAMGKANVAGVSIFLIAAARNTKETGKTHLINWGGIISAPSPWAHLMRWPGPRRIELRLSDVSR